MRYLKIFIIAFLLIYPTVHRDVRAFESSSAHFQISDAALDSIAGASSSTSFKNTSAGGQISTGISVNIKKIYSGILYWLGVAVPACGNGVIDTGEQCDGANLASQTCVSRGYASGALSCSASCSFVTTACVSGGGGGGGGGGGAAAPAVVTQAIFNGRAYPKSTVTLLKDAQIAATTVAGADANFSIALSSLSGGNYIFSVYSEDNKGFRSSLLTFPVSVTSGATTTVSGIFIAPTIAVDKSEVKRGDNIAIFGQSVPSSEITIAVNSDEGIFNKIKADAGGAYLYNFDTSPLETGQHTTKSKSALNGEISSFSQVVGFAVGDKTILTRSTGKCPMKADLNSDCRVNLVDFSIAAYWHRRTLSAAFKILEAEDLNGDGKVDLIDFSIMAYYWTG